MAEIIALCSLLLSVFVYFSSRNYSKKNEELITREVELIRFQLNKEMRGAQDDLKANVSVRMYKISKNNWKIRIYNSGPAIAKNVNVTSYDGDGFIQENMLKGTFPMAKMESGQNVDIPAIVHLQSKHKETVELTWDDPSMIQRKNTVEITI